MDKDDEKNTMNDTTSVEHSSTVETKTTTVDSLDSVLANTNKETEYDSSDLELSSDDDSDEDEATDQDNHDDDDEDDEDGNKKMQQLRTVNEVTDIVINKPQFEMKEDTEIRPVGEIFSVIDKTVVVQSRPGLAVLDMESLLVFEDRVMLGEVFETFGPVERPFYSVRFNDADEIDRSHAIDGAAIYYVPSYERTQLVQVEKLKLIKGTDASNRYDEEVGAEELEFSDDEQEAAYRQSLKRK
ncbi:Gar1/Naf1 RNA binding region-domain-containing protein [Halteromyces radiatus]|uniref:Gar1/Naf1 RNA binding region-domain-containing protein n=1 Tax=Halteromyces radiatus TaxID=101107 RepID=UPI00221EA553|nr:Gar1/Naf1 RNA binding region-domain-containing protein [Halteromyces radiatus]KAI8093812.1 Gar1/Naf1 RNA binding region-domain-containing protein [Halteromyces radiatus]